MPLTRSTLAPLSNELSCETGSFSHRHNPHSTLQLEVLSLSFPIQPALPHSCGLLPCRTSSLLGFPLLPLLPVWMNVSSLNPWLSDFHAVRVSGSSGCFCFSICCCPSFGCVRKQSISTYTSILDRSQPSCCLSLPEPISRNKD